MAWHFEYVKSYSSLYQTTLLHCKTLRAASVNKKLTMMLSYTSEISIMKFWVETKKRGSSVSVLPKESFGTHSPQFN
jgi:hypothetical protein